MSKVENFRIHDLAESIYGSGYPMRVKAPTPEEFDKDVAEIEAAIACGDYSNKHIRRAIKLAQSPGGGHDQFLTGITVSFDLTFSNKAFVEAERYTFLNFVSSMSTMHMISKLSISEFCNDKVDKESIAVAESYQRAYNELDDIADADKKKELYLDLLYSLPAGFELTARMTTNYRCLKNIYRQRKYHRLPDWHVFCDWVETLPMAHELIIGNMKG